MKRCAQIAIGQYAWVRNDRGEFPERALTQAARLIEAMEQGREPEPETPLIGLDRPLRPDLRQRLDDLRRAPGFACAAAASACAEVELVHAGNEYAQQQWRHAEPYLRIAEDLVARAEAAAAACDPAPVE